MSVGRKKITHPINIELNKHKHKMYMEISIRYSTIATKEAAGIGYNDFFFHMRARVKAEVYSTLDITGFFFRMSTQVKAEVRSFNIQYGQLLL
jgi:hypothetical protein